MKCTRNTTDPLNILSRIRNKVPQNRGRVIHTYSFYVFHYNDRQQHTFHVLNLRIVSASEKQASAANLITISN